MTTFDNSEYVLWRMKRRGIIDQREKIPAKRKRVEKPWVVCWRYGTLPFFRKRIFRRRFVTEQQATYFREKLKRGLAFPENVWIEHEEPAK